MVITLIYLSVIVDLFLISLCIIINIITALSLICLIISIGITIGLGLICLRIIIELIVGLLFPMHFFLLSRKLITNCRIFHIVNRALSAQILNSCSILSSFWKISRERILEPSATLLTTESQERLHPAPSGHSVAGHDVVDEANSLGHISVDPRNALLPASNAPGHDASLDISVR